MSTQKLMIVATHPISHYRRPPIIDVARGARTTTGRHDTRQYIASLKGRPRKSSLLFSCVMRNESINLEVRGRNDGVSGILTHTGLFSYVCFASVWSTICLGEPMDSRDDLFKTPRLRMIWTMGPSFVAAKLPPDLYLAFIT